MRERFVSALRKRTNIMEANLEQGSVPREWDSKLLRGKVKGTQ